MPPPPPSTEKLRFTAPSALTCRGFAAGPRNGLVPDGLSHPDGATPAPAPRPGQSAAVFCDTLREFRVWAGLNQNAIASDAQVSVSTVSRLENYRDHGKIPDWKYVDATVRRCLKGHSEQEIERALSVWLAAWREAKRQHDRTDTQASDGPHTPTPATDRSEPRPDDRRVAVAPPGRDDGPMVLPAAVTPAGAAQESRAAVSGSAYMVVPVLPTVRRRTPPFSAARRQRRRTRWRLALALALTAALATGAGVYAVTASRHDGRAPTAAPEVSSKTTPQPASSPPAPSTATTTEDAKTGGQSADATVSETPPLHWSGVLDALTDKQGIDLDNGRIMDQDAPGVDISLYGQASHIGAMDLAVSYAVSPEHTKPEYGECVRVAGWTRLYADVYSLAVGRVICVRTDQHGLSAMVIEKPANANTGTIGFRYYTWERAR